MLGKLQPDDPADQARLEGLVDEINQAVGQQNHSATLVFVALWNALSEVWLEGSDDWRRRVGVDVYPLVAAMADEVGRAAGKPKGLAN